MSNGNGVSRGDRNRNARLRPPQVGMGWLIILGKGGFYLGTLGCWPAGDFGVRATPGHSISWSPASRSTKMETPFLGIVLVVVGVVASIPILETIGFLLVVVGVILWILGAMGRAVGGRKHYY
jgi:hypothetical protein